MGDKMRKSIRNKLVTMAIVVAMISIVLLGIVSWGGFTEMRHSSYVMSTELVALTAQKTEAIIREQAMEDLRHLAEGTAQLIDVKIEDLVDEIELSEIGSVIMDINIGDYGAAFVVDNDGYVIIRTHIMDSEDGVVTDRENILDSDNPEIIEMIGKINLGKSGIFESYFDGTNMYWAYEPLTTMDWTVITLFNANEVLEPVIKAKSQTKELAMQAQLEAENIAKASMIALLAGMAASAVLAMLVGFCYSNKIAAPIRKLEDGVKRISRGELDGKIEIHTGDEIENLATAFNNMTEDLKQHITDLTSITAEKEKIGAELDIAAQMQTSMLPNVFPAFPEYTQFDLHATMIPAKEVGGDFYDFFMIDQTHLALVIADVSGKGVPAALFMVKAKTLIQNYAQKGISPKEILEGVNNELCANNDAGMFVTAWVGILDVESGEMIYANAGHNLPLLRSNKGEVSQLRADANFILAGLEDMNYTQDKVTLESGEMLFLYTDGVTEATNKKEQLYSEKRVEKLLKEVELNNSKNVLEVVKKDIDEFADGEDQFDDITMLGLIWNK